MCHTAVTLKVLYLRKGGNTMSIKIKGANTNNLKNIDVKINNGKTVITGRSGSGKTSLVFDTLYKESKLKLLNLMQPTDEILLLDEIEVESIEGIKPTVLVKQNTKNRNSNSTLATATGVHALLRVLYANYANQTCPKCYTKIQFRTEDNVINGLINMSSDSHIAIYGRILNNVKGSHKTLWQNLKKDFPEYDLLFDGENHYPSTIDQDEGHSIKLKLNKKNKNISLSDARQIISFAKALGLGFIELHHLESDTTYDIPFKMICPKCNTSIEKMIPSMFNKVCNYCYGKGCKQCANTGLYPAVANVTLNSKKLNDILCLSFDDFYHLINKESFIPKTAIKIKKKLRQIVKSVTDMNLGYLTLNRATPSLSQGEYQRLQLAKILTNNLDDMLYILDEPTIGLHSIETDNVMQKLSKLNGDTIYIEHDLDAISYADECIELGESSGDAGGKIIFQGAPQKYIEKSKNYISEHLSINPISFIDFSHARVRNVSIESFKIALGSLNTICGISGSGKSTLIKQVVVPSITQKKEINCSHCSNFSKNIFVMNQDPIGNNNRSTVATYTNIEKFIQLLFSDLTKSSTSLFSFNTKEGACTQCQGIGTTTIKMRYQNEYTMQCPTCHGQRYSEKAQEKLINLNDADYSIADMMNLSIQHFKDILETVPLTYKDSRIFKETQRMTNSLVSVGLGYLPLSQTTSTLSGGEAQRVKISLVLSQNMKSNTILVFDEPTTGLDNYDIENLLTIFDKLKQQGITLIVIEHNLDMIKSSDWLLEIGPSSGKNGGQLVFQGTYQQLKNASTATSQALHFTNKQRLPSVSTKAIKSSNEIAINNAYANNLKNVSLTIEKNKMTVVTGVSGSGKSSLLWKVLDAESKKLFIDSLSVYEKYAFHENEDSKVSSISGLGVTCSIGSNKWKYNPRSTVGSVTNIYRYLSILYATIGETSCPTCQKSMTRERGSFICPNCSTTLDIPKSEHFIKTNYTGACPTCQGVGTIQKLNIEKIVIHPEKPILNGALKSHGYFPKGFLANENSSGHFFMKAFAKKYHIDVENTPWNELPKDIQNKFIFGDSENMEVEFKTKYNATYNQMLPFPGFKGWLEDWDLGGTFTDHIECDTCHGSGLKEHLNKMTIRSLSIHEVCNLYLEDFIDFLADIATKVHSIKELSKTWRLLNEKITFMNQMGLSYLTLNRFSSTLSAGEAQRIHLTTLFVDQMKGLTILLDEPSRGLHHSEIQALCSLLQKLCEIGNTLIIVEHDTHFMSIADNIIEIGHGAGINGGSIVANGSLNEIRNQDNLTAKWLNTPYPDIPLERRIVSDYCVVNGAYENNLKIDEVRLPLNCILGICGVSGSGKSTLIVDTMAQAHIKKKQTTSVSYEPTNIGQYKQIANMPEKVIFIDQSTGDFSRVSSYLGLEKVLQDLYLKSEDNRLLNYDKSIYRRSCTDCKGTGYIKKSMEFMAPVYSECQTCKGTGYKHEAFTLKVKDISYPELLNLSISELYSLWNKNDKITKKINTVLDVGLGYLKINQLAKTLSTGEVQRLKLAKGLQQRSHKSTLYILDEPTTGLHNEDTLKLLKVLNQLVDKGASIWVVEHNMNLLVACDYLIELGYGGGKHGGNIIASGTPEDVALLDTPTGEILERIRL